jgi:hypothetical protein
MVPSIHPLDAPGLIDTPVLNKEEEEEEEEKTQRR